MRRSKYGAKKVKYLGMTFDSKHEFERYMELVEMEKAGAIKMLQRQVKYVLIPAQREPDIVGKRGGKKPGKLLEREVSYVADFVYYDCKKGEKVVEDSKGMRTTEYIIKRKLMLFLFGIRILET